MTAHKSWRRRFASVTATATAVLLAASGALMAPAIANAEEPVAPAAPQLELSKNTLDPSGDSLTVTGSGFEATAKGLPAYYGCEEAADAPQGFYVQLGWVKDNWRPSTNGKNKEDRSGPLNTWVADKGKNCQAPTQWTLAADGTASFEHTFEFDQKALGVLPEGARYAVFTHGVVGGPPIVNQPANELVEEFVFESEVTAPSATVAASVTSASSEGLTVSVDAKDLPADITSMYAGMIVKGSEASMGQETPFPAFAPAPFPAVTDGKATFVLDAEKANLDRNQQYEVVLWKVHSNPNPETIYARSDVAISKANWDKVFPEVKPVQATAKTAVSATKNGLAIKVSAKNLPADLTDMYAAVIIKGTESEMTGENSKYAAFGLPFPTVVKGSAEFTLQAPKKDLDRTKKYELFLWKKHGELTPENTYARVDVPVTAAQWNTVFPTVAPKIPFTDMKPGDKFYKEISWMFTSKLSTGTKQPNGTVKYLPKENVSREAMAAFLYRQYSKPGYKAPAKSPFTDVKTTDKFYKEIAWMKDAKISTGTKQANGTFKYLPKDGITREAMAAFMYRIDTGSKPKAPKVSPFADMKPGAKFYKEIAWMHSSGLSTGNKQPSGKPKYAAKDNVTREAMAAFLFRAQP